jgi:phosphopentomutase
MKYGHRSDVSGYAAALSRFDAWLPEFTSKLGGGDVLIITADHGCDPGDESTDHTREYTPLLVLGDGIDPTDLGTRASFADIAATVAEAFGVNARIAGKSFYKEITEGTV